MVIASRTDLVLPSGFTQTTFGDFLKQAFLSAGFPTVVDDYTASSDRNLVFSHILDASKTYGTTFLKVRISSSLTLYQQLYTSWNTTTNTGNNGSDEVTYQGISSSSPVSISAFSGGTEYRLLSFYQGSSFSLLGIISPLNRPAWWDLNSYPYGFILTNTNGLRTWRSTNITPYRNTEFNTSLNSSELSGANPITGKRDIIAGLIFLSQSSAGVAGKTSDDLVQCAASSTSRYDTIVASGNQYLILNPGIGTLGLRIA